MRRSNSRSAGKATGGPRQPPAFFDEARATGHLDLVRTDFGVGQGPWTSGQWVALEVVTSRVTPRIVSVPTAS
jgi:hypothetical protein